MCCTIYPIRPVVVIFLIINKILQVQEFCIEKAEPGMPNLVDYREYDKVMDWYLISFQQLCRYNFIPGHRRFYARPCAAPLVRYYDSEDQ